MRCDIIGAQMNAIGSRGKRDVRAGVNEETSSKFSVLSSQWSAVAHGTQNVPCQHFQFPCAQILFAKLDVVDAGTRGFSDFGEQGVSAGAFVAAKLASIGNVIEHTAVSHQLSAYYECGADTPVQAKTTGLSRIQSRRDHRQLPNCARP